MSEYQYYEFQKVDDRLTEMEMRQLRKYSSGAQITPSSFTIEYNLGDFRGNASTWRLQRCQCLRRMNFRLKSCGEGRQASGSNFNLNSADNSPQASSQSRRNREPYRNICPPQKFIKKNTGTTRGKRPLLKTMAAEKEARDYGAEEFK